MQLCGDAHLSNFGIFASPERTLLFDLNDFDETLPGPFEYDVKRMAASFTIAARNNGFTKAETREATLASVEGLPGGDGRVRADGHHGHLVRASVREGDHGAIAAMVANQKGKAKKEAEKGAKGAQKITAKARTRDSLQALSKLARARGRQLPDRLANRRS